MGTLANSEDQDEMQPNAAFHQGLHCLLILIQPSGTEMQHNLENSTSDPFNYTMGGHTYCINVYGKISQAPNRTQVISFEAC